MPEEKAINKVIYGGNTLMDITDTTATSDNVAAGLYFYTAAGVKTAGTLINGNNLEYGITDGSIPKAGIAKVGLAHAWDDLLPMMIFGEGEIGVGRVV